MVRFILLLLLSLCLAACSTTASQAPAPAQVPVAPAQQPSSGGVAAPGIGLPGAAQAIQEVRLRTTRNLADAPKFVNFPVLAPEPAVLTDNSIFQQMAVYVGQLAGSDPNNPVQVGAPLVELLYRGANGFWSVNQGVGGLGDFLWRYPNLGQPGFDPVTVRGQKAWLTTAEGPVAVALYWEEGGKVYIMGGRLARQDYLKLAETMKPAG